MPLHRRPHGRRLGTQNHKTRWSRKLAVLRNPGLAAARRVLGLLVGQVQFPIPQHMAVAARMGQEHRDVALLDVAGCAAGPAGHLGQIAAFLRKPAHP